MTRISSISIIIPAFNEEKRIKKTLEKIIAFAKKRCTDYEIIVVDDASTDGTARVVRSFSRQHVRLVSHAANGGKGRALATGVSAARKKYILLTDADLATPIAELTAMYAKISKTHPVTDIVIASRNLPDSRRVVKQPWYRQIAGKTFPLLVNILLVPGIADTQCGFKLFKTSVAKKLFKSLTIERFAFDVEMLYLARMHHYIIVESPVFWIDQPGSKVKLIRDTWRMFWDVLRIRWNAWTGRYR